MPDLDEPVQRATEFVATGERRLLGITARAWATGSDQHDADVVAAARDLADVVVRG